MGSELFFCPTCNDRIHPVIFIYTCQNTNTVLCRIVPTDSVPETDMFCLWGPNKINIRNKVITFLIKILHCLNGPAYLYIQASCKQQLMNSLSFFYHYALQIVVGPGSFFKAWIRIKNFKTLGSGILKHSDPQSDSKYAFNIYCQSYKLQ